MTENEISVYPVGLFSDVKRRRVRKGLKGYLWLQMRRRNWRAVRNYFNGYLAEPYSMPLGVTHCGRGWTKRAALRSLDRRYRKAGYPGGVR